VSGLHAGFTRDCGLNGSTRQTPSGCGGAKAAHPSRCACRPPAPPHRCSHPFCYFPAFYLLKGAVEGRPLSSTWAKYKAELWTNCKALWTIWVPAQLVNFAVVPRHLRIPYVAGVSFIWTVIISLMRGAVERQPAGAAAAPATPTVEAAASAAAAAAAATPAATVALEQQLTDNSGGSAGGSGANGSSGRGGSGSDGSGGGSGGEGSGGGGGGGATAAATRGRGVGASLGLKALVGSTEVQT
jgi:hypothetical protein